VLNATQVDQLKRSEERNERIGRIGGWAVIFGLLLEIGSALYFGSDPSLWRRLIPAIPTAVVALGVFLEVWFHRAASRATKALQSDAEERAAESNRMAEEARERTAKLEAITAWRRVSREGRNKLISAVKHRAQDLVARVEFQNGDAEAGLLANEIGQALYRLDRFAAVGDCLLPGILRTSSSAWWSNCDLQRKSESRGVKPSKDATAGKGSHRRKVLVEVFPKHPGSRHRRSRLRRSRGVRPPSSVSCSSTIREDSLPRIAILKRWPACSESL
jgi:hypothetical protein